MADDDRLLTPAEAFGQREVLDRRLTPVFEAGIRDFLSEVKDEALSTVESPAVIVAGLGNLMLGTLVGKWQDTAKKIVDEFVLKYPGLSTDYVRRVSDRIARAELPQAVYQSVLDLLNEGQAEQWQHKEYVDRISDALSMANGWDGDARALARTEATAAMSHTTLLDLAQRGVPYKRWLARLDPKTRPSHELVSGETIPLARDFIVAGYAMEGPGDPAAPASLTRNCRCVLLGVWD